MSAMAENFGVHRAYKCTIRDPWWRPPKVPAPDIFFTYMSHRFPRLIANTARTSFVDSMHGGSSSLQVQAHALGAPLARPQLGVDVGAEVFGRSSGGGILKMEPREAASLPVPAETALDAAWRVLEPEPSHLDHQLRDGRWTSVLARVDEVLLRQTLELNGAEADASHEAARSLRERRLGTAQTTEPSRAILARPSWRPEVGHPLKLWDGLKEHVQAQAIQRFANVRDDWLDVERLAELTWSPLPRRSPRPCYGSPSSPTPPGSWRS